MKHCFSNAPWVNQMNKYHLNGWWRLYIAFIAIWLSASAISYFYSLPDFNENPEQIASNEIQNYIDDVQAMTDPIALHQEADQLCEEAYNVSKLNKNECMSFLITPKEVSIGTRALISLAIERPMLPRKINEVEERLFEEKKPKIISETIRHIRIATTVPLTILAIGYAAAWIRRGFQGNGA